MKKWDVFISHASEDKELVARPLSSYLQRAGIKVWLDENELTIGDSLREKIDEGLAQSRFGIVILSKHFLAKEWPQRELNGLVALEEGGYKVILPVWYQISKRELSAYSPILADKLAADASNGVRYAVKKLLPVLLDPRYGGPATQAPNLSRRLASLIDTSKETSMVRDFLEANPLILARRGNHFAKRNIVISQPLLFGSRKADFCVGCPQYTSMELSWTFCLLAPLLMDAPFSAKGVPAPAIESSVLQLSNLLQSAWKEPEFTHELLSKSRIIAGDEFLHNPGGFAGVVFAGRRDALEGAGQHLRKYSEALPKGICLTTYDSLVDAAQDLTDDPD